MAAYSEPGSNQTQVHLAHMQVIGCGGSILLFWLSDPASDTHLLYWKKGHSLYFIYEEEIQSTKLGPYQL